MRTPDSEQPVASAADVGGEARAARSSWLATQIGRVTLRFSRYPGRGMIGSYRRKLGRRHGAEPFTVHTDDGVALDALYCPARPRTEARLPIVMMHGWIEVKEFHLPRVWRLNRAGHDVIIFDHRAHGRSGGAGATFGARERHDLAAVIRCGRERGRLGQRYITMGFSMGAAVALQHAGHDANVAGVVAFAPYVTFEEAIESFREKLAPWVGRHWLTRGFERAAGEMGFGFDDASTLSAVGAIEAPVLLIEAGCDTNLPPAAHTRKLAAAKTRGPVTLHRVDQATHLNLCRKRWPGLERVVTDFCAPLT